MEKGLLQNKMQQALFGSEGYQWIFQRICDIVKKSLIRRTGYVIAVFSGIHPDAGVE
jgi:hypothetical protein